MPPGRKPKPPGEAVNRNPKAHPYKEAPGAKWSHGATPDPPEGLDPKTLEAWELWFSSWWSSFWTPADVPALRVIAQEFDQVVKGRQDFAKVSTSLDRYGITPKGRTDLRWAEPAAAKPAPSARPTGKPRLRVVDKTG